MSELDKLCALTGEGSVTPTAPTNALLGTERPRLGWFLLQPSCRYQESESESTWLDETDRRKQHTSTQLLQRMLVRCSQTASEDQRAPRFCSCSSVTEGFDHQGSPSSKISLTHWLKEVDLTSPANRHLFHEAVWEETPTPRAAWVRRTRGLQRRFRGKQSRDS